MRKVEVKDIEQELLYLFENKKEDIIWCVHERPLAFKSRLAQIDEKYCREQGVGICNSFNFGGTIVVDKGDINLAVTRHGGWNIGHEILQYILDRLKDRIPNLSISNNDLLYQEKYKLISFASINVGDGFIYSCWNITINPNIEMINNICTKEMIKIPKSLEDFGVTGEEIIKIFEDWEKK